MDDSPRPSADEVSAANARLPKGFRKEGLGSKFAGGNNFHMMHGENNNYRGGLDDGKKAKGFQGRDMTQFFKDLKTVHGIRNVITLNSDHPPGTVQGWYG